MLLRKYIYGPSINEPICMIVGSNKYYYHYDGLGSVVALTDSAGTVVEAYSYDAFGTPSGTISLGNSYLFTGRQYDTETGNYYYRARYYKPSIGRFLQTDPIGYEDSINLYVYVTNNPVNSTDPSGSIKIKPPRSLGCVACMASVALACGALCTSDPVWDCSDDTWGDCVNKCMSFVFDPRKSFGPDSNIVIKGVVITCAAACIIGI